MGHWRAVWPWTIRHSHLVKNFPMVPWISDMELAWGLFKIKPHHRGLKYSPASHQGEVGCHPSQFGDLSQQSSPWNIHGRSMTKNDAMPRKYDSRLPPLVGSSKPVWFHCLNDWLSSPHSVSIWVLTSRFLLLYKGFLAPGHRCCGLAKAAWSLWAVTLFERVHLGSVLPEGLCGFTPKTMKVHWNHHAAPSGTKNTKNTFKKTTKVNCCHYCYCLHCH